MNYAVLDAAMKAVVKTNGNKEITGANLQSVLSGIINALGEHWQFAGIATPSTNPDNPDANLFYLAFEGGEYTHFSVEITGISIIVGSGNSWEAVSLNLQAKIDGNNKLPYSYLSGTPTIPTSLRDLYQDSSHRVVTDWQMEAWNGKQGAISDLATIRSGAAAGATALQPSALTPYRTASAQDEIDDAIEERLDDVEEVIPAQASSSNQLADKNFVNSSVQTASANFRGNWATKSAIPTDYTLYPADYAGNKKPTTNDYLVVQADESQDGGTWRYKYSGDWDTDGVSGWFAEYEVNETPLTSAQLAALNSGITSGKVTQYDGYAAGKQDKIDDLDSIRTGAGKGNTAVQPSALDAYRTSSAQDIIDAGKEGKNYIDEDTSTTAVSEALVVGKTYKYMPSAGVATLAFTLTPPTASDEVKFWRFKFKSGATATEFTPPANLWWNGGESLIPEANTIYEIMIDEDYCVSVLSFKQVSA